MEQLMEYVKPLALWAANLYTSGEWFVLITLLLCVISLIHTAKTSIFKSLPKKYYDAAIYGGAFLLGPILITAAVYLAPVKLSYYFIMVWSICLGPTANGIFYVASKQYKKRMKKSD